MRVNNNLGTWSIRYLQSLQNEQVSNVQSSSQTAVPFTRNISTGTIAERMRSQINDYREAMASTYNAIGVMSIAEGGLQNISTSFERMKELAVQASRDTLSNSERTTLQKEFSRLSQSVDRVVEQTTYDGKRVLGGDIRNMQVELGVNQEQLGITLPGMDIKSLELEDANVSSAENAQNALKVLDNAIQNVAKTRDYVDETLNKLGNAARNLGNTVLNTSSVSSLNDTNAARNMMDLVRTNLLSQATAGVVSQSNINNMNVLRLLG
ncbi:MAG TPA: flagellin [Fervidobacterium sp.]|nr:flagellin [Fervidobacterium sp.]HRD20487.1 flagellin [Fervidobacterium sp.]